MLFFITGWSVDKQRLEDSYYGLSFKIRQLEEKLMSDKVPTVNDHLTKWSKF